MSGYSVYELVSPQVLVVATSFRTLQACNHASRAEAHPHEWGLSNDRVPGEGEGYAHLQPSNNLAPKITSFKQHFP